MEFLEYPKISIITPSFNQGLFLESCINSVIQQKYPNLEYIVLDGGSTDLSKFILKRYSNFFTFWRSGKDDGQYFAIQEGIEKSTGELIMWLNSDDMLHPGSLWIMAEEYLEDPDALWFTGIPTSWSVSDELIYINANPPDWTYEYFINILDKHPYIFLQQESTFFTRKIWEMAGGYIDTKYNLAADFELWLRFSKYCTVKKVNRLIGGFRIHDQQKTAKKYEEYLSQVKTIIEEYIKSNNKSKNNISNINVLMDKKYKNHHIATSLSPKNLIKQDNAIESWKNNGFQVHSFNSEFEITKLKPLYPKVIFHVVEKTAMSEVGKPLVYIKDILNYFYINKLPFTLINADILMSVQRGLSDAISFHLDKEIPQICLSQRVEIENELIQLTHEDHYNAVNRLKYGKLYIGGFDMFSFNISSLDIICNVFHKCDYNNYCLGLPWWDYFIPLKAIENNIDLKYLYPSPIYHYFHEGNYSKDIWRQIGIKMCKSFDFLEHQDFNEMHSSSEYLESYLNSISAQIQRFILNNVIQTDLGPYVNRGLFTKTEEIIMYMLTYKTKVFLFQNENEYLREIISEKEKQIENILKTIDI